MKSILDPTFRYTASFDTDLRRTFARVRRDTLRETTRKRPEAIAVEKVTTIHFAPSARR
jgi:hypothetical protein